MNEILEREMKTSELNWTADTWEVAVFFFDQSLKNQSQALLPSRGVLLYFRNTHCILIIAQIIKLMRK